MATTTKIQFGNNLSVTDTGGGVIRVDGSGPTGSPGTGDLHFTWTQSTLSAVWNVVHNLGKFPAVSVVDSGGNEVETDVDYIDTNNLKVTFGAATSGKVYCN